MKNMALSQKESDEMIGMPESGDGPKYPYGLELHLNDETIKKLGLSGVPAVGEKVTINAVAVVSSASMRQEQDGDAEICCSLQITDMEVTGAKNYAKTLYSDMDD